MQLAVTYGLAAGSPQAVLHDDPARIIKLVASQGTISISIERSCPSRSSPVGNTRLRTGPVDLR
jgi:hypothetical protein